MNFTLLRYVLSLHIKIAIRSIADLGFGYALVFLSLLALSFIWIYNTEAINVTLAYTTTCSVLHLLRTDKKFLSRFGPTATLIMQAEYFLLALFFIPCLLLNSEWVWTLALLCVALALPLLKEQWTYRPVATLRIPFVGHSQYETLAGIRRNWPFFICIYLIILFLYWNFSALLAGSLLLNMMAANFYLRCEPLLWLESTRLKASAYLLNKYRTNLVFILIMQAPVLILALVFHPQLWYLSIYLILIALWIHFFAIIQKYAAYEEGRSLEPLFLLYLIFIVCTVVPLSWPVAIAFSIRAWRGAHSRLTVILQNT